ncbi:hypothetical protein GS506_20280 [Rhodococcus hoagii]|nr:hypothetical protein [Prescottella equi]
MRWPSLRLSAEIAWISARRGERRRSGARTLSSGVRIRFAPESFESKLGFGTPDVVLRYRDQRGNIGLPTQL